MKSILIKTQQRKNVRRSSGLRLTVELAAARIVSHAGWAVAIETSIGGNDDTK